MIRCKHQVRGNIFYVDAYLMLATTCILRILQSLWRLNYAFMCNYSSWYLKVVHMSELPCIFVGDCFQVEMQGKAASNRLLWLGSFPNPAHSGSFRSLYLPFLCLNCAAECILSINIWLIAWHIFFYVIYANLYVSKIEWYT